MAGPQVLEGAFDLVVDSIGPFPHKGELQIYLAKKQFKIFSLSFSYLPLLNGEFCLFLLFVFRAQSNDAALAFLLGDCCCCSLAS